MFSVCATCNKLTHSCECAETHPTDAAARARKVADEFFEAVRNGDTLENVTVSNAITAALKAERERAIEECAKIAADEAKSEGAWMLKYQAEGNEALMQNAQGGHYAALEIEGVIHSLLTPEVGGG